MNINQIQQRTHTIKLGVNMKTENVIPLTSNSIQEKRRAKKSQDIISRDFVNFDGVPLPIQNKEEWGIYVPCLRKIHTQLINMLSHHYKVFALRMDFHVNQQTWKEGDFSTLIKKSKRLLKSHYKTLRIGHAWGREISQSGNYHYHLILLLDGSKVNNPIVITNIFTQEWKKLGHPQPRRNNHHMLTNTFDDKFKDAFHHFSYIAKIYSKDQQPTGRRNFSSSQIKPSHRQKIALGK
jgi:hypothetical protein